MINRPLDDNRNNDHGEDIQTVSLAEHARGDADYVLTLEEIGALAAEGGKPAETLMNVVALIAKRFATDVCSAYLLEPDRANLVLAASLGLRPSMYRHSAHADSRRALGPGGRASSPDRRAAGQKPSALQILQRGRRRRLPIVPRRSAHRSRCFAGRPRRPNHRGPLLSRRRNPHDDGGRCPGRAGRQRSAHAGAFYRSRPGAALVLGAQPLVELGSRLRQPVSRSRSGALAPAQSQSGRAAGRDAFVRHRAPRRRTGAARPYQLRLPPPAGISAGRPYLGRANTPACCGRVRWPIFPPSSACTNRFRSIPADSACWPAITSRAPPISIFR